MYSNGYACLIFKRPLMDPKLKQKLKINLGAVKRLIKEKASYEEELAAHTKSLETTEFEQGSYEFKNLVAMKNEAEEMIQDTARRLEDFKQRLIASYKPLESHTDDELVHEAAELIASF